MGFFINAIDWTLSGLLVLIVAIGGLLSVISIAFFGALIKALPFLIKLGAVALLAYFGLAIFGIV